MDREGNEHIGLLEKLPEECILEVVSRTGPMEACRLSVVSKRFLSAAESNILWQRLLPSDYQQLLNRSDASFRKIKFAHKKDLFLFLIGNHVIIDGNTLCFWLHKRTGKKFFLVAASFIGEGDIEEEFYVRDGWYRSGDKSRFQNRVTVCKNVEWFEIHGKISTSILSPNTTYTICLVFHSSIYIDQHFDQPVKVSIGIDGVESIRQIVCLNPHKMRSEGDDDLQYPQQRKDDRFEVKLGEYFNREGDEMNLEITMMEVESEEPKNGPGIEGFELRPKNI
ncbi:F-box domain-containing protein [Heracleum sosnowskyi]|uniref:F-box domain-containing protein n=1 Tax=Heracleum sosnowskyi TaxID=360622 RepID=A0AAD8MDQ2_9APIA|nr:F-box domain-containing protein [Heracleum sosnowskyi]